MGTPKAPEKTKALLLEAALQLFATKGYFATSVHDIRKAAGLSIGAVYHHFENKETIARALYEDIVENICNLVTDAAEQFDSAHDKCQGIARALCAAAVANPELLKFILHARHREFLPDTPPVCSTRPFEYMQKIVASGIAAGEITKMDPIAASTVVFGGVIRLLHLTLDGVLDGAPEQYFESIWKASWRGVAA